MKNDRRQFNIRVTTGTITAINRLMGAWGCNNQGEVVEVLVAHAPAVDPREQCPECHRKAPGHSIGCVLGNRRAQERQTPAAV
jgi:hypothetical protein